MNPNIYNLSFDELITQLSVWGEQEYRANQIWSGLYQQLWDTPTQFTNLPKTLRQALANNFSYPSTLPDTLPSFTSLQPVKKMVSSDGETVKTLFSLSDNYQVEAVLMRYNKRQTLCISTQAGCAMGCVFCATGQMGFRRNLSSGEIIEQVLYYARQLALEGEQVTNIVVMGMGEPFHNYDATLHAIRRLNHPQGFNLGSRRFTISTVGLIPGIKRFTAEHSQINLAISLHAADDSLRTQLLPINRKYPLDELFAVCHAYVTETHRRLSFEWALIQGINDTAEQAHRLIQRLKPFKIDGSSMCHVNLIPLNPTRRYSGSASSHAGALAFKTILDDAGVPCTIRLRRGIEIQAGCGQLASSNLD
jgi:23S rRNA (adenine2503-C2)-methyltransferase